MTEREDKGAERACGVGESGRQPCGRSVHDAPDGVDKKPVCLMHSKDSSKSTDEFCRELQRIISEAEQRNEAPDFTEFVFPSCSFKGKKFPAGCTFIDATFTEHADFSEASFTQDAFFFQTRFLRGADFSRAQFAQHAIFMRSEFLEDSLFEYARFESEAVFMSAKFYEKAGFLGANFGGEARFGGARFKWNAQFDRAKFCQRAEFNGARFARLVSFERTSFQDALEFHETRFRHDFADKAGLDFNSVELEHPERVRFYRTDLGQALFYYTDISKIDFALASWRDRGRISRYLRRKNLLRMRLTLSFWVEPSFYELKAALIRVRSSDGSTRICLFEEDVYRLGKRSLDLAVGPGLRNLGLIAEMYQQLKRNFDAKGDYWTAGQWHYGEMEMKRRHSRFRWKWLQWLGQHSSLVALYRYASSYGESYLVPLVWLGLFLVGFAFLYPIPGLQFNPPAGSAAGWLGYADWRTFFRTHPGEHPAGFWGMILHGLMTSLSVAGFQRELRYAPSYPWGRLMALFELLLTTTLGGLFLLAIRRQFKRS